MLASDESPGSIWHKLLDQKDVTMRGLPERVVLAGYNLEQGGYTTGKREVTGYCDFAPLGGGEWNKETSSPNLLREVVQQRSFCPATRIPWGLSQGTANQG